MNTSFSYTTLGSVAKIQTGPFGSQLHAADYVSTGIPSIMPNSIGPRLNILEEKTEKITIADAQRLNKYLVQQNDIIYSRRGDVEKCAIVTPKENGWLCGTGCLRVRFTSERVCPQFCAYYLSTDEIKGWVSGNAVGTTMPNLNTQILQRLPLVLPPLAEQQAIAAVLSSLDDKIDLLHRQNKTLEALAQTLFRQWFVEEADKNIGVLGNIIELSYGKALKEEMRSGTGFPVFGSNGIVGYHSEPLVKGPGIVIGRKGTLGNAFYIPCDFFPIDTTYYIVSKGQCTSMYYEYFLLKSLSFENSDSAVPGLNREIALSHEITIPNENVIRKFEIVCHDLFNKIHRNTRNIKILTKLRDTLLPKLMSGEVRVAI